MALGQPRHHAFHEIGYSKPATIIRQFPLINKLMSTIVALIILFPIAFFSMFLYTHTIIMPRKALGWCFPSFLDEVALCIGRGDE
jgi:hypothetical protein